ncbi:MAG: RNA ligase [Promethearchaeota archaeon]|jgi:RNA ligase
MTRKTLTILVGPQGSGKTFHCQHALQTVEPRKANPDRIVRISQDEQGKKGHIEQFLDCLDKGYSMVIDRINHLRNQRRRYTEAARKAGYKIKYVWFDVDRQLCMNRLHKRTGHPTINRDRDNHERILACYFREFEKPEHYEYDEIEVVTKRRHANILDLRETIGDKKFIVVGDIHGCFDEFMELLNQCGWMPSNFVISVGDLMDRGPKSREVVEWFLDRPNTYIVEGNHDNKARRYWAGRRVKVAHGLNKTIEQCEDMNTAAIAQWIETWPQMIQLPDINGRPTYVVHAGVDGNLPIDRQPVENCLYARYFGGQGFLDESGDVWYSTLDGSYNVISGHMIHAEVIPTDCGPVDFVFLLDGGAYQGGELRALVVENGQHRIEAVKSKNYQDKAEHATSLAVSVRDELVDQQLLRCDDKGDFRIYTYTDNCTYSAAWNDVTMNSRGIILNRSTGEVIAHPFPKFFNVGEREETMEHNLPWTDDYLVFEKMDGWLGTLYRYEGEHCVATRGSFDGMGIGSWATAYLRQNHDLTGLPDEVTLVFEIICPQTHIIVDYGDREELILLAAFNRHTSEEYDWNQVVEWAKQFGFPIPRIFGSDIQACQSFLTTHSGNEMEGFVIRFENLRVKIKSEDYKRRAAIVANLTPLSIWKVLRDGIDVGSEDLFAPLESMRETVDADYLDQFNELVDNLRKAYTEVYDDIHSEYERLCSKSCADRKEFALKVQSLGLCHPNAMFSLADNKKKAIEKYILKKIRPNANVLVTG